METVAGQVQKITQRDIETIAIVGLSDNPRRYSYEVAAYLKKRGVKILPINPKITETLREKAYPNLAAVPREYIIDVVLLYRRSEEVMAHVKEVIARGGIATIWLPEGVENKKAQQYAKDHGVSIVSNFCIMKEHKKSEGVS